MKKEFNKKILTQRILILEWLAFSLVISILWIDELFDFPNIIFDKDPTPFNYEEAIFESILILILAIITSEITKYFLNQIKILSGFLPVCASCKRIRIKDEWIQIESYIRDHSQVEFSHSYCPVCAKKIEDEIKKMK